MSDLTPTEGDSSLPAFIISEIEIPKDETGYLDKYHDDGIATVKDALDKFGELVCHSIEFLREGRYDKVFQVIHDITVLSKVWGPILKESGEFDDQEVKDLALACIEIIKKTMEALY